MPRPQSDDLLQSFRYRVLDTEGLLDEEAGFSSVTTPEVSFEVAEYREGHWRFTRKQLGVPTVESVTLQRGIMKTETTFNDWVDGYLNGRPYRTDLMINVYDQVETGESQEDGPTREMSCKESIPSRHKGIGDLEGTSSDINLQELECAVEEVEIRALK